MLFIASEVKVINAIGYCEIRPNLRVFSYNFEDHLLVPVQRYRKTRTIGNYDSSSFITTMLTSYKTTFERQFTYSLQVQIKKSQG